MILRGPASYLLASTLALPAAAFADRACESDCDTRAFSCETGCGLLKDEAAKQACLKGCLTMRRYCRQRCASGQESFSRPDRSVVEYPDYGGYLIIKGKGDRSGWFRIRFDLDGLYVAPNTPLSALKEKGMTRFNRLLSDKYFIFPRRTSVTVSGELTGGRSFQMLPDRNDCLEFKHLLGRSLPLKPVTKDELDDYRSRRDDHLWSSASPVALMISDRSPAGGAAEMSLVANSLATERRIMKPEHDGTIESGKARFRSYEGPGAVRNQYASKSGIHWLASVGAQTKSCHPDIFVSRAARDSLGQAPVNLFACTGDPLILENGFSLERFEIEGGFYNEVTDGSFCDYINNDTVYNVTVSYFFGAKKKFDATLEPVATDEAQWLPEPGEVREYKLTLGEDIDLDEVEAVRFRLEDTSRYSGITTNAGRHYLPGGGGDCTEALRYEDEHIIVNFANNIIHRQHFHYNDCAIDSVEDLFFKGPDHPGFDVAEAENAPGLKYPIAQEIILESPTEKEITAAVTVMDSAAFGKLKASYRLGGLWYDAEAKGDTAGEDNVFLHLPRDMDENGLQDDWEAGYGIDDPGLDRDTHAADRHPGDGLTAFEEYRGVYVWQENGSEKLERTHPGEKDIFVHDYSGVYRDLLYRTREKFTANALHLWVLTDEQMKGEVINFRESEHHRGEQYVINIMDSEKNNLKSYIDCFGKKQRKTDDTGITVSTECIGSTWKDIAGKASHVGPPTKDHNTIVMDIGYKVNNPAKHDDIAGTLGHEIGHQINMPHHGHKDPRWENIVLCVGTDEAYISLQDALDKLHCEFRKPDRAYIAKKGGEHSGDIFSMMTYRVADYICDVEGMNKNACTVKPLARFPSELIRRRHFSTHVGGTGFNANGQYAGDATTGGDLPNLNVKSY